MSRPERSVQERRRIGQPTNQKRIDVLERVIAKLMAFSTVNGDMPGNDPDRADLSDIKDKLDQLDIDFPDAG